MWQWLVRAGVWNTLGGVKDVQRNHVIQKKMERPLGSHGTSQLTQGTPEVCRRRAIKGLVVNAYGLWNSRDTYLVTEKQQNAGRR